MVVIQCTLVIVRNFFTANMVIFAIHCDLLLLRHSAVLKPCHASNVATHSYMSNQSESECINKSSPGQLHVLLYFKEDLALPFCVSLYAMRRSHNLWEQLFLPAYAEKGCRAPVMTLDFSFLM